MGGAGRRREVRIAGDGDGVGNAEIAGIEKRQCGPCGHRNRGAAEREIIADHDSAAVDGDVTDGIGSLKHDRSGIEVGLIDAGEAVRIGEGAGAKREIERAVRALADDVALDGAARDIDRVAQRRQQDRTRNRPAHLVAAPSFLTSMAAVLPVISPLLVMPPFTTPPPVTMIPVMALMVP